MDVSNGKPSPALSDPVDYSRLLHNGVPQGELESLLREHDRTNQEEISSLRRQLSEFAAAAKGPHDVAGLPDRSGDVRSEVSHLRQELATAMTSIRGLLTDGDSGLHEMQLTSLRRQVSQLEGVLESNYQRELRVAEERETALRSEMAQMRQDLRVALETLYKMPSEEAAASANVDLSPIEERMMELRTALVRVAEEQQARALEREGTMKAELAHMRRDLLVTLEASYQPPTDRVEALDAQTAEWHSQVQELQRLVIDMQEAQREAASRQQSTLHAELREFRQELQTTVLSSLPPSEHEELAAQQSIMTRLAQRLDEQASEAGNQFERIRELINARTSALEAESESLRAGVQSLTLSDRDDRVLEVLAEREERIKQEFVTLHDDVATLAATVSAAGPESVDYSTDLHALRDSLTTLGGELSQAREDQRTLLSEHTQALNEGLAASQAVVREAATTFQHSVSVEPTLTVDTIGEMIVDRLGDVQSHWSAAQTELYRQLVSQMAEIQSDVDLMNTAVLTIQPIENDGLELGSNLLDKLISMLERQQIEDRDDRIPASSDDLIQLRNDIQEVRIEVRAALQTHSTEGDKEIVPAPAFSLDDVVQAVSSHVQTRRDEDDRLAVDRDAMLQQEFAQVRADVRGLVQQMLASTSTHEPNEATVDLSGLQSDIAEMREGLARIPDSHQVEVAGELEHLRHELHSALESLRVQLEPRQPEGGDPANSLAERVAELELALRQSQAEQQQWVESRDEVLYRQLAELRSGFSAAASDAHSTQDEAGNESWRADLAELRGEIASLAHHLEPREERGDLAIIELVTAVRTEMHEALETIRSADPVAATRASDAPAIQDGLTALAVSIQQATANQDRWAESQQQGLQAAIVQMREELRSAVSGLSSEGVDSFEKRQSQLRMDQLEMERNLAQLRQELVATHADPGNKKKLWR